MREYQTLRRPRLRWPPARHHDRVVGRAKSRMARLRAGPTVTRNRSLGSMGWRSRRLPP